MVPDAARSPSSLRRFALLIHEQNGWLYSRSAFDHHLLGWISILGTIFPLGLVFRPRSLVVGLGFALPRRGSTVILYTDRDMAPDLRPPVAARRGASPMRQARRPRALVAPRRSCRGVRPCDPRQQPSPSSRQAARASPARVDAPTSTRAVTLIPNSIRVYDARGRASHAACRRETRRTRRSSPRVPRLPARAPTPSAGRRSRATVTSSPASSRSACASTRREPTQAYGATGPTTTEDVVRWLYFVGLALLARRLGFRLLVLPRAVPSQLERRVLPRHGNRGSSAIHESGSSPFSCERRTRCSSRSVASSTATSPRSRRHPLRRGLHRDDARLRVGHGARSSSPG